jgi:hypothetical protein
MESFSKSLLSALIAAILALFCDQAQSAGGPINGSIDFGGTVTFGDSTGANTMSLSSATRVNVWNSSFVLQDSGDFSSISPGTNVTMGAPWIFNPSTATPSLWSVGGFKFDLSTSVVVSQSNTFLNISGTGTLSGNGFSPTPGTWSFTSSDSSGQPQATFGFQAQSTAVPEANSIYLFAFGVFVLAGASIVRRKFSLTRQLMR